MPRTLARALPLLLVLGAASSAPAAVLTYTLSGEINFIHPDLAAESPPFAVGDPFVLTFSVDSEKPTTPAGPDGLQYNFAGGFSLTLNSAYTLDSPDWTTTSGSVIVVDGTRDQFQNNLSAIALPEVTFPADLGVFRLMQVVTTLHDADGSSFSSTALPTSLDATLWTYLNDVSMIFRDPSDLANQRTVNGTVTFASVAMPEPASLLFGLAAVGLARLKRRLGA